MTIDTGLEIWDEQLDRDAGSGRLEFLAEEVRAGRRDGTLEVWPDGE